MAGSYGLRDLPEHLAVVRALIQLKYEFEDAPSGRPAGSMRGFAPDSVVEVVQGPPLTVALLFSASDQRSTVLHSTMSLVTLASVLGVDFTGWLSSEMARHGFAAPWRSSRRIGSRRVSAEYFSKDAVLLKIECFPTA